MGKQPLQVNIPGDPAPPPQVDLQPIYDRVENVEQLTGDLRERTSAAEAKISEHLQHATSTQEALTLAQAAHDLAKSALSKVDKMAKEAAAVPAAVVHDLPAPEPLNDPILDPTPNPEPRKPFWKGWL